MEEFAEIMDKNDSYTKERLEQEAADAEWTKNFREKHMKND